MCAQVLDGVAVEAGEQAASRNLYAGRLTLDSLAERVGHSRFERLRELDLSGMALRELGDVFTKEEGHFTGLQMLTLDNNELTEVRHPVPGFAVCSCNRLYAWSGLTTNHLAGSEVSESEQRLSCWFAA